MRHPSAVLSLALLLGGASAALAQPSSDPLEITAGKLTGWYKATISVDGESRETRATMFSRDAKSATLELDDRVLKLVRKNVADEGKLVSAPGIIDVLDPDASTRASFTIVDRVTLEGEVVEKLDDGTEKRVKVTLRRVPRPARSAEELAEFDAGPPPEVQALFEQCPPEYKKYFKYMWWKFGPVFYRGRLDKSARLMLIGSDPGPTECLPFVKRCFVGDSGQRMQGFLTKLGLTKSYVFMNGFAYALFPSASNAGKGDLVHADPKIVAWRNKCYSAAVGPNLQAIVVIGFQAKKSLDLWTDRPNVPVFYVPHPSRFDGEPDSNLLPAYRSAVEKLRKIVTPDDPALAKQPNYGEEFTEHDFSPIPRRDLPKGAVISGKFVKTPEFIGEDSWTRTPLRPLHNVARRPSPDTGDALIFTSPDMKVRRVVATPPTGGNPTAPPTFSWGN